MTNFPRDLILSVIDCPFCKCRSCDNNLERLLDELMGLEDRLICIDERLSLALSALSKIAKNKTDEGEIYTMGCDCDEVALSCLEAAKKRGCKVIYD